jgi:hypothetical protein
MCQRECRTVQRDCGQAPTSLITVMIGTPASKQASEQRSSEAHRQMLASSQRSESRVPLMVPVHRLVDPPLPVHDRRSSPSTARRMDGAFAARVRETRRGISCKTTQIRCWPRQRPPGPATLVGRPSQVRRQLDYTGRCAPTRSSKGRTPRSQTPDVPNEFSANATRRPEQQGSSITVRVRTWEPTTSENARPKGPCTVRPACCRERRSKPH